MFHAFLHTCLLIHLFSFAFGSNVLFSPHSVGSPSNLLLGRDEWLGRYCITLPVSWVCVCVRACTCECVHASGCLPTPPLQHVWGHPQSNRKERHFRFPPCSLTWHYFQFVICSLLRITAANHAVTHAISCFLGCCVDLLKEVWASLLLRRLRLERRGRLGVAFPCWCCALWCQFRLDAGDLAAFQIHCWAADQMCLSSCFLLSSILFSLSDPCSQACDSYTSRHHAYRQHKLQCQHQDGACLTRPGPQHPLPPSIIHCTVHNLRRSHTERAASVPGFPAVPGASDRPLACRQREQQRQLLWRQRSRRWQRHRRRRHRRRRRKHGVRRPVRAARLQPFVWAPQGA